MSVLPPQPQRGVSLLLAHCFRTPTERESAYTRLEHELGGELTRLLVVALSSPQGRRGSSSP